MHIFFRIHKWRMPGKTLQLFLKGIEGKTNIIRIDEVMFFDSLLIESAKICITLTLLYGCADWPGYLHVRFQQG